MQKRGVFSFVRLFLIAIMLVSTFGFAFAEGETTSADAGGEGMGAGRETASSDSGSSDGGSGGAGDEIESTPVQGIEEMYSDISKDVEFQGEAGITPDSALYGLDNFVEGMMVGDSPERALEYKEEKVAEAQQMIDEGNVEAAIEALEGANEYRDVLEKEVSPEIEKRARESSYAVKEIFREIEGQIEGEQWDEVRGLVEEAGTNEDRVAASAKISSQIQSLCETLSQLDPLEYSRMCSFKGDAPRWQEKMNKELTKEQEKEAKEFFNIMSKCFKNPKDCECNKISVSAFAEKCAEVAPIAADCQEGKKEACKKMETIGDPTELLPDYLQGVMGEIQGYQDSKMGMYMPQECISAGATTPESCSKIMFKLNAPPECVAAAEEGKIDVSNPMSSRRGCDKIMFERNAPKECVEAGMNDMRECGKVMFQKSAPQECLDAGFTGEIASDGNKCRKFMESQMQNNQQCAEGTICVSESQFAPGTGPSPAYGARCKGISDPMERLKCYDSAGNDIEQYSEQKREVVRQEFKENFVERPEFQERYGPEFGENMQQFAGPQEPGRWEGGRFIREGPIYEMPDGAREGQIYEPPEERRPQPPPTPGEQYAAPGEPGSGGSAPPAGGEFAPGGESAPTEFTGEPAPAPSEPSSGESSGGGEPAPAPTGSVILTGNSFVDYYYK